MNLNIDLKLLLNGASMAAVHTTRYSSKAVIRQENVAEHTFHCMWTSYIIAMRLNQMEIPCSVGFVLRKALVHDIEEPAGTGDILRNVKHSSAGITDLIHSIGENLVSNLDTRLDLEEKLVDEWRDSKDKSIEGQVVRIADICSVVGYLCEEHGLGNRTLKDVHHEVFEYFHTLRSQITCPELLAFLGEVEIYFRGKVLV